MRAGFAPLVQGDIVVRPLTPGDTVALHRAVRASMDALSPWLPWCHPGYSEADAAQWIDHCVAAWQQGTEFPLGIFDTGGELLGGVGLSQVDRARRTANLGYWVTTGHCGRGVATVASRLLVRLAFEALDLDRIEIAALPHNLASRRVAEKLGAVSEGEVADRIEVGGKPVAAIVHALSRSSFPSS